MAEQPVDDTKNHEESFEDLLDAYSPVMGEDVQVGDKIRGEIISIGGDSVFVDTGTKIDGVVEKTELIDENGELPYQEGDVLELYVDSYNGNEIRLSRALTGAGGLQAIHEAYENAVPVEGKVKAECKGGFHVEIMGRRAFCPISQMDSRYIETPGDYTGGVYPFLVMEFEEEGRNIVVSRRELLLKEQEKKGKEFLETIATDQCLEGRVTKLMPYGAFVELCPGIEGMVHISEISWSRLERPEDGIAPGDHVSVKIIGLENKGDQGQVKISLSIKQASDDPWNMAQDSFPVGVKVKGTVTRCMKFGAFVEIAPGVEGLVHISEMSYQKRVLKPEDVAAPGDQVEVMIKEIDPDRRRISLSIKDAEGDPWVDVRNKYRIGQVVKGTLERKEAFGFFISLEPGITGLMPRSKVGSAQRASALESLREGATLTVTIEEILPVERKMTLSPADPENEADWKKYTGSADQGMGTLGEKLKKALKTKG